MAFYGSSFPNNAWQSRPIRHARHIACPQRLKYIHDVKDEYIPCVEDSDYINQSSYRNVLQKTDRLGLYNTADVWRKELMGLAQQVQSSLLPVDELPQSRSSHSTRGNHTRSSSSKSTPHFKESSRYQHLYIPKSRITIGENEQESSTNNKNQDSGIWLLPILCHILQVDNILDAQEWLVNANPMEKRLAMQLISRTMQDMQNDRSAYGLPSSSSNFNNLYWPYKFWQHQQQSKLPTDNNDTCERGTSPVRFLTPAKQLSTPSVFNRSTQSSQSTRCSSSRLLTPLITNHTDRQSRRSHRITTSRNTSIDNDPKSLSANIRGKTPLI